MRPFWYIMLWATFVVGFGYLVFLVYQHLKLLSTWSILSQYHRPENTTDERALYLAFWQNNFELNHKNTNDETRKHIINTLRVYERIGLLIRKGGVNRHLVVYLIGDVGTRLWLMLENYIQEERTPEIRGDRFWHAGFEYLVMLSFTARHFLTSK